MFFARALCILAIVVLSGLDQAAVQTYAWASMLNDRAPNMGLTEALNSTFSGDQPCEVCCALAELTEKEQENAPAERQADQLPKLYSPNANSSSFSLSQPQCLSYLRLKPWLAPLPFIFVVPTPPPEIA
ncbi:MAG: hypothetical protein ACSHYF_00885 [Verrucomicrobiaceae bacterium]